MTLQTNDSTAARQIGEAYIVNVSRSIKMAARFRPSVPYSNKSGFVRISVHCNFVAKRSDHLNITGAIIPLTSQNVNSAESGFILTQTPFTCQFQYLLLEDLRHSCFMFVIYFIVEWVCVVFISFLCSLLLLA